MVPQELGLKRMLVLASKSPRRAEILRAAGIPFLVRAGEVQEERRPDEAPADYVRRLAQDKGLTIAAGHGEIILSADTIVVVGDEVLGKPAGANDARRMLGLLAGRAHDVITGICLRSAARCVVDYAVTRVVFSELSAAEITAYVESGEPEDKAGAYAIQGLASKFIERIEGDYFNVVGLPVALVYRHLARFEGGPLHSERDNLIE